MKLIKETMNYQDFIELQKHQLEESEDEEIIKTNKNYQEGHKPKKTINRKSKRMKFWNYR